MPASCSNDPVFYTPFIFIVYISMSHMQYKYVAHLILEVEVKDFLQETIKKKGLTILSLNIS